MKFLLSLLLVFCASSLKAQTNFSTIDQNSQKVPDTIKNYRGIAKHLTSNLETDEKKARALYIWITNNISYDVGYTFERFDSVEQLIEEALDKRIGVCQHYSELFLAMSKSVRLDSYLIRGYTKDQDNKIASSSHAWNAVRIDSSFYLIDATWGAGYVNNGKFTRLFKEDYFLAAPEDFIENHMPFDPMWQLTSNPISYLSFEEDKLSEFHKPGNFQFTDSIAEYSRLPKLEQFKRSNARMEKIGIQDNSLVATEHQQNTIQITSIEFNKSVDTLNYGINRFNTYIEHKNKQFKKPKLDDADISRLIKESENGIYTANENLNSMQSIDKELGASISEVKRSLPTLLERLTDEKEFVTKYLKKWKPLRSFMFYSFNVK